MIKTVEKEVGSLAEVACSEYSTLSSKRGALQTAALPHKNIHLEKENIKSEENFFDLVENLNGVAEKYKLAIIISTHPRTRKMIEERGIEYNPLIQTLKPLEHGKYRKSHIFGFLLFSTPHQW